VCVLQGCSVRLFGSKGSIKFVKVLEPSNCSSSSMCIFENGGFCLFHGHTRPNMLVLSYMYIIYYN
jgi:hypothetical protein